MFNILQATLAQLLFVGLRPGRRNFRYFRPVRNRIFKISRTTLALLTSLALCWLWAWTNKNFRPVQNQILKISRTTLALLTSLLALGLNEQKCLTLKFGVLISLLVDGVAVAYAVRLQNTVTAEAKPSPARPVTQRSQHSRTPHPTPRPTQPSMPSSATQHQPHAQTSPARPAGQTPPQPSPARPAQPNPTPPNPARPRAPSRAKSSLFFF